MSFASPLFAPSRTPADCTCDSDPEHCGAVEHIDDVKMFAVSNTTSGAYLGAFPGATPLAAYQAMMRDAGYRDASHAASAGLAWDEIPADIAVREVEADEETWPEGWRVQIDRSGRGHDWRNIELADVPADVAEAIAAAILEDGESPDDGVVLSNGQRYRWFAEGEVL